MSSFNYEHDKTQRKLERITHNRNLSNSTSSLVQMKNKMDDMYIHTLRTQSERCLPQLTVDRPDDKPDDRSDNQHDNRRLSRNEFARYERIQSPELVTQASPDPTFVTLSRPRAFTDSHITDHRQNIFNLTDLRRNNFPLTPDLCLQVKGPEILVSPPTPSHNVEQLEMRDITKNRREKELDHIRICIEIEDRKLADIRHVELPPLSPAYSPIFVDTRNRLLSREHTENENENNLNLEVKSTDDAEELAHEGVTLPENQIDSTAVHHVIQCKEPTIPRREKASRHRRTKSAELDTTDNSILSMAKRRGLIEKKEFLSNGGRRLFCIKSQQFATDLPAIKLKEETVTKEINKKPTRNLH